MADAPETHVVDPALGVASDRVAGRALAAQTAMLVFVWQGVFHERWLDRFTLHRTLHGIVLIAAAALAALVLGPVVARARTPLGAALRAIGLGVVAGAVVVLAASPLAHIGSVWGPGLTWREIVFEECFCGGLLGFFAGLAAIPLVVHHVRIREARALDAVPRLYLFACATLLVPCLLAVLFGALRSAPAIVTAIVLCFATAQAQVRRLEWLSRVREGREPGYRLDEASEEEIAGLPAFSGEIARARGVVMRAADAAEERGAHPFRAGGAWVRVARVSIDPVQAAEEARLALRSSVIGGLVGDFALIFAGGLPILLFILSISA